MGGGLRGRPDAGGGAAVSTPLRPGPDAPVRPAPGGAPPRWGARRHTPSSAVTAAVAGLAVVLAASALSGVLHGSRWVGFVLVTVAVVVLAGTMLRSMRLPSPVVVLGQLAVLAALLTAVFTRSGALVVLPGPDAFGELGSMLAAAGEQVRVGIAPVPTTPEMLCLITLSLGLVAITVDVLAVVAAAPAASGMALLCVVAVPASLDATMLPWWTFALGAAGFAMLLTVDGQRRHLVWGDPAGPGGNAGAVPTATAVATAAVALGLVAGGVATGVGTEGRLPGSGSGGVGGAGIGLNPFTALRGQLEAGEPVELFRVRGLTTPAYLRALTLSRFEPGRGWTPGELGAAVPAAGELPLPGGLDGPPPGVAVAVRIEPVNYQDNWLPSYGVPREVGGVAADWRYYSDALTAFSARRQLAAPYTLEAVLPVPGPTQLRAAGTGGVDARYLQTDGLAPQVIELAGQVTAGADTPFDRAVTLNRFFTQPGNGFRYDEETAPGSGGDALVDFLLQGRTGYCEQYASSMAIMLRAVGVPARVAIGFTAGTPTEGFRRITTEDAHAWVEAWFDGVGWIIFDPTPLADGRTVVPPYVAAAGGPAVGLPLGPGAQPAPGAPPPQAPAASPGGAPAAKAAPGAPEVGSVLPELLPELLAVLLLAVLVLAAPALLREAQRRGRLRVVAGGGPDAADTAWRELRAESVDRGGVAANTETVRAAGRRLAWEHEVDEAGRDGLRAVVRAVERSWYGTPGGPPPTGLYEAVRAVQASLRRSAPLTWRARLLPPSVLIWRHRGDPDE